MCEWRRNPKYFKNTVNGWMIPVTEAIMIENFVIDTIKPKTIATLLLEAPRELFPKRSGKVCYYRKKVLG